MATTQSECEDIARQIGLGDTSATTNNPWNCRGNHLNRDGDEAENAIAMEECYAHYRCSYHNNQLFWNPNCDDNVYDDHITNLCKIPGNEKAAIRLFKYTTDT